MLAIRKPKVSNGNIASISRLFRCLVDTRCQRLPRWADMPLITPPSDEPFEPEPVEEEPLSNEEAFWKYRRIKLYMDCQNWKCSECGCVVFGRCLTCPYCRHKLGKITNRPKDYKVHAE